MLSWQQTREPLVVIQIMTKYLLRRLSQFRAFRNLLICLGGLVLIRCVTLQADEQLRSQVKSTHAKTSTRSICEFLSADNLAFHRANF